MPKVKVKIKEFDKVVDMIKSNVEQKAAQASKDAVPIISKKLKKIRDDAADNFYGDYSPIFYTRNRSLEHVPIMTRDNEGWIEYNASMFGRSANDYVLFNTLGGFHGGARSGTGHPNPGTPFWRTPFPEFVAWGDPAVSSDPPLQEVNNNIDKAQDEIDKWILERFYEIL